MKAIGGTRGGCRLLLVTAAIVATSAAGCSRSSFDAAALHTLSTDGGSVSGTGQSGTPAGQDLSFGDMFLCLTRPMTVIAQRLVPLKDRGGLKIVQWGLRPNPYWTHKGMMLGGKRGSLTSLGIHVTRTTDLTCDKNTGRGVELLITAVKGVAPVAHFNALKLEYSSGDRHGSVIIKHSLSLCTSPTAQCLGLSH